MNKKQAVVFSIGFVVVFTAVFLSFFLVIQAESDNAARLAMDAALADSAAVQTRAVESIVTIEAEAAAMQTSEADAAMAAEYEVAAAATAEYATIQARAASTEAAISATQTRQMEDGMAVVAVQETTVALTAEVEALAMQCVQTNGYAFEIVEIHPLDPHENIMYVWTNGMEKPLTVAKWTVQNTGICTWGLDGFTVGLLDSDGLDTWSGGTLALLKDGQNVGGEVQVMSDGEAELVVYFRGPGNVDKEFILVLGTVGGDVILLSQPRFEVNATNWTILLTPTPSPTSTPTPTNTPTLPPPPPRSTTRPTVPTTAPPAPPAPSSDMDD